MSRLKQNNYSDRDVALAKQEFLHSEPNPSIGDVPDYSGVGIQENIRAVDGALGITGQEYDVRKGFSQANYENLLNRVNKLELFMEVIRQKFDEYDMAIAQKVNDRRTVNFGL